MGSGPALFGFYCIAYSCKVPVVHACTGATTGATISIRNYLVTTYVGMMVVMWSTVHSIDKYDCFHQ